MSDRTVYVEILGKSYPMRFTIGASRAITDRYGSVEAMGDIISAAGSKAIFDLVWLLELFMKQGCAYKNLFCKDEPIPENAPVVDGKWVPLTAEELEIALEMFDLAEMSDQLFAIINRGQRKDIETQTDEKN